MIEGQGLEGTDPARGKFRSFLITSFRHFMTDQRRSAAAEKRGGGMAFIAFDLDQIEAEVATLPTEKTHDPETFYDRHWAQSVIDAAVDRLAEAEDAKGRESTFFVLREFLTGDTEASLKKVAGQLGMTHGAVRVALSRLRTKFRRFLRLEIKTTLGPDDDVDTELRYLIACLRK